MSNKSSLNNSYQSAPKAGASAPGEVEAWGLTQAALRMIQAQEKGDKQSMVDAVRLNWRLWTIFQAELFDPDSTVSADIRTNLLSLAQYIDKHTVDFLAKPAADKLETLININRELALGLYTQPEKPVDEIASTPEETEPGSVKISV